MIDYETYARIKNYFENDGLRYSQIADVLSLDIRTVTKWAKEKQYRPRKSTRRKSKLDPFKDEKPLLQPLPHAPYDIGQIKPMRASRQFRVTIDTNHYSVPAQLSGVRLSVKSYPDRICIYHENALVARHVRSYDRRCDFEHPDHAKALLQQRKKAKYQIIFMRFLSLSAKSQQYYRQLEQRRMNPSHHIRQIVALSEIYENEAVARAMEDAFSFATFSCEYVANLLEQRTRPVKTTGALHLTRSSDLLDLTIDHPDLSIYDIKKGDDHE